MRSRVRDSMASACCVRLGLSEWKPSGSSSTSESERSPSTIACASSGSGLSAGASGCVQKRRSSPLSGSPPTSAGSSSSPSSSRRSVRLSDDSRNQSSVSEGSEMRIVPAVGAIVATTPDTAIVRVDAIAAPATESVSCSGRRIE